MLQSLVHQVFSQKKCTPHKPLEVLNFSTNNFDFGLQFTKFHSVLMSFMLDKYEILMNPKKNFKNCRPKLFWVSRKYISYDFFVHCKLQQINVNCYHMLVCSIYRHRQENAKFLFTFTVQKYFAFSCRCLYFIAIIKSTNLLTYI